MRSMLMRAFYLPHRVTAKERRSMMSNPTQREYPEDRDNTTPRQDQLGQELAGPEDQTGLAGAPDSPDNSGLVGTPNAPDNTGLAGSSGMPRTDQAISGDAAYGNDTGFTGTSGYGNDIGNTGNTGAYGAGTGGPGMSGQTRTPETDLLDPGYNPQIDQSGDRLDDLNRAGQPGTPDYDPDYPSAPGQPTPTPYSGAPNNPGIPDQAGTQDQTTYTNRSGSAPAQGDAGGMAPDQSSGQ